MRRHSLTLPALALAAGLALAAPAKAQVVIPPQPFVDMISLNLSAEDWVRSETALVTLIVDAAGSGTDAANLRAEIVKAAQGVTSEGEWRIVRMDRMHDDAGLERWQAEIQARLPEPQLAGLGDKTKKVSRPGLQLRVGGIAFDPTLAEVEAAKSKLRADIYAKVNEELKRLNGAFPDRQFRVANIDFFEHESHPPQPYAADRMMVAESKASVQGGVQDKLKLSARVSMGAFALPPKE
ncbi:hypothetical protein [Indioceanicola profundi]|uniref:hypothetical protein n=1 Tax=Indioceanicola profundi TaxID=2220096 RepID=UPI000E6AB45A|nr:hypothetical protein [Indioceanicola profundi]